MPCCPALLWCLALLPCPAVVPCPAALPCPALSCPALQDRAGQGRTPCRAKTHFFLFFGPIERSRRNPCYFLFLRIRDYSCISNRLNIYFHYQKSSCNNNHRKKNDKMEISSFFVLIVLIKYYPVDLDSDSFVDHLKPIIRFERARICISRKSEYSWQWKDSTMIVLRSEM